MPPFFQFTFREEKWGRKNLHNLYCIKSLRRTQSVACSNNSNNSSRFDWFLTLSVQQFWSFVPFHSASSCEMRFCWFDLNIVCFCFQRNIYFPFFQFLFWGITTTSNIDPHPFNICMPDEGFALFFFFSLHFLLPAIRQ